MGAQARASERWGPTAPRGAAAATRQPAPRPGEGPVFFAAGFWRRAAAAAIDLAFVLPAWMAAAWIAGSTAELRVPHAGGGTEFWLDLMLALDPAMAAAAGLLFAVVAMYTLVFVGAAAQTPGLRAMGAKVIDAYGDPPSIARTMARIGGLFVALATLGLGLVWIAFDREKRGLPDWVAGTFVVKEST